MKSKKRFDCVKIPCMLLLIGLGFLMEFLIQVPFLIMFTLDRTVSRGSRKGLLVNQPKQQGSAQGGAQHEHAGKAYVGSVPRRAIGTRRFDFGHEKVAERDRRHEGAKQDQEIFQ